MPQLFTASGQYSGVIFALMPDPGTAESISTLDGVQTTADQLHITLAYYGKVEALTDAQIGAAIVAAEEVANYLPPVDATINGIGRFNASESSGGQDVIYGVIDAPGIEDIRWRLSQFLDGRLQVKRNHGFTPHITFAYIPAGSPSPIDRIPTIPLRFSTLSLLIAGQRADFPFRADPPATDNEDIDRMTTKKKLSLLERLAEFIRQAAAELEQPDDDSVSSSTAMDTEDRTTVERDTNMGQVWEQVRQQFWQRYLDAIRSEERIEGDPEHYLQDLYVGSGGGIFAITTNQGRLFRSPVFVSDNGVTVGEPVPVSVSFTPQQRTRAIARTEDGRPVFLSILGAATINKDGEIDSRALFDTFAERFKGDGSEYVNIYHLGKDKTRIGSYSWIGRDGYLLLGAWTPDDTPLARAVAATLEADEAGEWGNSIEFQPDNEGEFIEIAPDIEVRAFDAGTFAGCSIVSTAHACHWFTANRLLHKERNMNENVRAAVLKLVGGNESLLKQVEAQVDDTNRMITDSGAVTRTAEGEQEQTQEEAAAETVVVATLEETTGPGMADVLAAIAELKGQIATIQAATQTERTIELTPEAAQGIATVIFTGAEFTQLAGSVATISGALEQQTRTAKEQAEALTARIAKLEEQTAQRLAALERTEEQKIREHEEMKPRGSTVTVSWRAPRGDEAGNGQQKARSIVDETDKLLADLDSKWG